MAKQKLNGSKVFRLFVDDRYFRSAQGMRSVVRGIKADTSNVSFRIRAYWRVDKCRESPVRLGKRYCQGFSEAASIQLLTTSRLVAVTSNLTGR